MEVSKCFWDLIDNSEGFKVGQLNVALAGEQWGWWMNDIEHSGCCNAWHLEMEHTGLVQDIDQNGTNKPPERKGPINTWRTHQTFRTNLNDVDTEQNIPTNLPTPEEKATILPKAFANCSIKSIR